MNYPCVGLILLAAGESKRMGTPKQLLSYKGNSLIRHAATEAIASNCHPVIVVLGANSDRILTELNQLKVYTCHNLRWQKGMSVSISMGIKKLTAIESNVSAVIIALGDQPLVTTQDYNRLIENYDKHQTRAIASTYVNTLGVPALFDRTLFPDLLSMNDKGGAKQILKTYSNPQFNLDLPQAAIDIDTPADYQKLLKL